MENKWNNNEDLFLTREMVENICDISFISIDSKAQKGLCFKICENFVEIIQNNVENGNLAYNYEDNPNILIIENNETRMTEIYSKRPMKIVCNGDNDKGLFEEVLLTRLCLENLDLVRVKSMKNWFSGAQIDIVDFSNINTPQLDDMSGMFRGSKIKTIIWGDLQTSFVTNMSEMFLDCEIEELFLEPFITFRVKNMSEMFRGCTAKKIDCSEFDTLSVRYMDFMFEGTQVQTLDLSGFNTKRVENMALMFSDCIAEKINIKNFDMTNVKSYEYMFNNCSATLIAKDKKIIKEYEQETGKKVSDFCYVVIDDILNAKLENLDVDVKIVNVIKKSTSCERIIHLWMLSPHELCYQLGLSKEELDILLNEMIKVLESIGETRPRYINHIHRCRKYYCQLFQELPTDEENKYYMVKIKDSRGDYKSWLGWSNSNGTMGFYHTNSKVCKIFSAKSFKEDKDLIMYLQGKEYELVPIDDVTVIQESRIYY